MQTKANKGHENEMRTRLTALTAVDLLGVGLLRPPFAALARHVAHPHAWITAAGADGALAQLAGAALWFTVAWFGAGLLAALAGRLPGTAGALGRALGRRVLPAALYRLAAGSAGLGVLLAPAAALALPSHPAASAAPVPTPTWPAVPSAVVPTPRSVPVTRSGASPRGSWAGPRRRPASRASGRGGTPPIETSWAATRG
jgi:hypothetical protein